MQQFLRALFASCLLVSQAFAQSPEKFVFYTNWFAQAEHGGFYQALARGIYKKYGLDVELKMGGPQVNGLQLLAGAMNIGLSLRSSIRLGPGWDINTAGSF